MRTRKPQEETETPTARRLRQVAVSLGLGMELPQAWLAKKAGIPRSTLQNAADRDSLSHDLARKIAVLMVGAEDRLIAWLRGETPNAPEPAALAPRMPQVQRSPSSDRRGNPSSGVSEINTVSGSVWVSPEEVESLSALARRIAESVKDTVQRTLQRAEMGHSKASRELLAKSLVEFGKDLNARCDYPVAGDIFEAALWLLDDDNFR